MITPNDIRRLMAHRQVCEALEKKLDAVINHAALKMRWPATLGPAALGLRGESAQAVDEVLSKYRAAGWTIARVSDPRDGDFIKIEAPAGVAATEDDA